MERYDKYKGSSISGLKEIPDHWQEIRMRYIGFLYGGLSGKSANDFNKLNDANNKSFIPFTNIASNLKVDKNSLQSVVVGDDEKQNEVAKGDLFFLMSSENYDDVGLSSVLCDELEKTYLNSFCKGFRVTNFNVLPVFLNYQLRSKELRHNLLIGANGFTRINLKIDKVNDLKTAIPPLPEQTDIANYLDRKTAEIDALIAKKKRLLELYEEEKTAIINHAVTKGINPDAPMKDSGIPWLGEVPEHWEVKKLKYIVDMKSGNNITSERIKETGDYPVYGGNGIRGYYNEHTHDGLHVLIGRQGALCGNINYADGKFWASEHAVVCTAEVEHNVFWFGELLKTMNLNQYSVSAAQPGLSVEKIKNLDAPFPSVQEQNEIASFLDVELNIYDTKVDKVKNLVKLLSEYRTALISEVVTGKVKVTE